MRVVEPEAMDHPEFPAGPKSMWRAALAADIPCRMTLAKGTIIGQGGRELAHDVPNLCLAMLRHDGVGVVAEWHLRSGKWKFVESLQYNPARLMTSKETRAWMQRKPSVEDAATET